MKDLLFSSVAAEELNSAVQNKVASHLFISCNYEPEVCLVFSDDAKFILGSQNLYKFAVDTSCIISKTNNPSFCDLLPKSESEKLCKDIQKIKMIRAVLAHNNSEKNGRIEQQQIEEYNNWLRQVICKLKPECAEDYKEACDELYRIGNEIYDIMNLFITAVAASPRKSDIIKSWQDCILKWYCNGTKRDIFLGQLEDVYLARAAENGQSLRSIQPYIKKKVANWIQRYYLHYPDQQIQNLELLLEEHAHVLDSKALIRINQKREELEKKKSEITEYVCHRCNVKIVGLYTYQDCFFLELEEKLRDTLQQNHCRMLPHELLQQQIEICFKDIPSADF